MSNSEAKVEDMDEKPESSSALDQVKFNKNSNEAEPDLEDLTERLPYPKSIFFIVTNEFCERFTFYGMRTVLSLYLKNELKFEESSATVIYHVFIMICYFFPLLGAIVADSWLGKFRTILYLSMVYAIGNIVISVAAVPYALPPVPFTMLGLVLIALGTGGIKPCVSAFGGDQFKLPQQADQLEKFFSLFYFSINSGSFVSTFLTPVLREASCFGQDSCYSLAFGVPAVLMILAIIIFLGGKPFYKIKDPDGNVVVKVVQCMWHAASSKTKSVYDHWLDKAQDKYEKGFIEDIKATLRVLVLFIPLPIFWALFDQQGSRWTFQAARMNGEVGSFKIQPDQMQVVNPVLILVFIPLFQTVLYPLLAKCNLLTRPLQKLTVGGTLAAIAFGVSALIEMQLEPTYAILPQPKEGQLRLYNGLPYNLTVKISEIEENHFELPSLQLWENINVPVSNEKTVNLLYSGNGKTVTHPITIYEESATSYVVMPNRVFEIQKEDLEKSENGNPKFRIIFSAKQFGHEVISITDSKGENGKEFKVNFENPVTGFEKIPLLDEYTLNVNGIPVLEKIVMKQGGVYTALIVGDGSKLEAKMFTLTKPNSVHILWLIPQYVIITAGEIMFSITGLEFSFTQAPATMKSLLQAAWLLTVAMGNLVVVIVAEAKIFKSQKYEFILFGGLMLLDMLVFALMAMRYTYVEDLEPENAKGEEGNDKSHDSKNDYGYTIYYLNNEGNEIPIENVCDFEEALRLAKLNNKSLKKLIACSNQSGANYTLVKNQCESCDTIPLGVTLETIKHRIMQEKSFPKCQCQCNGGVPPDWFLHYMKKFKKELLHELKSSLGCSVPIAVEKKLQDLKKEIIDLSCSKIEATSAAIALQNKKKKKGPEKGLDLLDQRETKMTKKSEKVVKLEKLDNKTKVLMEEKRRLLEKKRHLKQRFEKNNGIMESEKFKRSATFGEDKMCLFLSSKAKFAVTLNFRNDGTLRWEAPRLECYNFNGLYPKDPTICLPRLRPQEKGFIIMSGMVSDCGGVYYFKCRIFDNQRKISPEFICWAKMEPTESVKEISNAIIGCKESSKEKIEESEGVLIDFEKDEFTATQKKIEENINEIQRKLQDIDLLRPSTSSYDLGVDCLRLTTPGNNYEKHEDKDDRVENIRSDPKNVYLGSNSDSELSLISLSEDEDEDEDDEDFVMITMVSESVNEDKQHVETFEKSIANSSEAKADSLEQKPSESLKTETLEISKEDLYIKERRHSLPDYLEYDWPSSNEVSKSRAKKIKPNSSKYFMTANLPEPIFIRKPERFLEKRIYRCSGFKILEDSLRKRPEEETITHNSAKSRAKERIYPEGVFLKRGSEEIRVENKKENISVAKDQLQKENAFKDYTISRTDGSKNVIYAVNSNGHCFPVEELSEDWRIPRDRAKERIYPEGVFLKKGSEDISVEKQKEKISTPKCNFFERHSHNSTKSRTKERIYPEGVFLKRGSEEIWVENKKESISVAKDQLQQNAGKDYTIPATNGSRNVIYAVSSNGHCFPVEEPRDSSKGSFRRPETEQQNIQRSERRDDRFNEVPGTGVLLDTINVASRAFNTAKSVFNNIHSAFVTDGKTEMGKPASENRQEISSYAMCILVEMGFTDIELNRYLLLKYQNDLMKVIEDLLEDSYFVGYSK